MAKLCRSSSHMGPGTRVQASRTREEAATRMPKHAPAGAGASKRGGNKRHIDVRAVMNGIMYVLSTGRHSGGRSPKTCRHAARCSTISTCGAGTARSIASITRPYVECREQGDREASPTAAIIDSQSVKSAEKDTMERRRGNCIHRR